MRASQIKSLQDSVFGRLGEEFTIFPADGTIPVRATGIWFAEGSERAGPTDVDLRTEADEIVFRRDDTAAVAALSSGEYVGVMRVDTGVRYDVQGLGELRAHKHSVRVTEAGR